MARDLPCLVPRSGSTPEPVQWNELLTAMGRFGFAEREAKLYLLLSRRGRATARDLTRDSQIDRVPAYRSLDAMRSWGLVQVTAERGEAEEGLVRTAR
jgi:predicted transcriptional regulator